MRKPANITPLYRHSCPETPETPDFNDLWVSSTQNGIHQTWKPLYTMFSRGNVVEKMRIRGRMEAGISTDTTTATTTTTTSSTSTSPPTFFPGRSKIRDNIILDLYAGIGYFVFPYTTHSPRLVLGWEINPHSVEGLVRAAPLNSVDAVVVPEGESISKHLFEKADNSLDTRRKNKHLLDTKIVIFNESNETAIHRIREFREAFPEFFEAAAKTSLTQQPSSAPRISHINLGLLPTSRPTWALACEIIATPGLGAGADEGGWVHVHENVDVGPGVAEMGRVIVGEFEKVLEEMRERRRESGAEKEEGGGKNVVLVAECVNVFVVKTYAPGVVHCVFDVWVHPRVV
ncbi:S-adenosyl-L-methionine-dependent methyltransferase [Peziza echinospora]|nr:S-adenosyl-L-methionine-dependent methyltransferase [Peziza echinospora]